MRALRPNWSESEHDLTPKTQNLEFKRHVDRIVLYMILSGVVVSYLFGGLLGENSAGASRPDFYEYHWVAIQQFSQMSWSEAIRDYPSASNPLLYMIASLLPFNGNPKIYHVITFTAGLLTWLLLSWAYYRRYARHGIDLLWASFGASAILLSPSFRSSAFWGTTDYLPLLFCAVSSLILSRIQDFTCEKAPAIGVPTLIVLSVVAGCAFYVRQYYAFLPVFAAWIILTRTKTPPFSVLAVFAAAMMPEVFLFYLWKGFNPPTFQGYLHPAIINILIVGTNIGLLSTPLVFGCIRRSLDDVLPEWWGARSTIVAFAGLFVFIVALRATEWPGPGEGGGIIVKAGLRMGALGTPFILAVSYFGLVAAIVFSVHSATNALLASAFLAPILISVVIYQHYLEPSLIVALFLFADTPTAKIVFNKRVLTCNFVFSVLILVTGIVYYHFS